MWERFDAKFMPEPMSGCWLWIGGTNGEGYGQFWIYGDDVYAHRVAYERWVGPIPEGLELDHLCRQRRCVNPEHLEPVTRRENARRGLGPAADNARMTRCRRGLHDLAGDNLIVRPCGRRRCRACATKQAQRRWGRPLTISVQLSDGPAEITLPRGGLCNVIVHRGDSLVCLDEADQAAVLRAIEEAMW